MLETWDEPLADDERDRLLRTLAIEIKKRKMEAPAVLFFETHKPLAFLGSQAGIVFAPFLAPFAGIDRVRDYSRIFRERDNVDRLLILLETPLDELRSSESIKEGTPAS